LKPLPQIRKLIGPHSGADPAGIDEPPVGAVVPQQQRADERAAALGVGPADDHEFLPVEALGLEPEPALAREIAGVQPLRDDAPEPELAGVPMKRLTLPDLMIAVPDGISPSPEESGQAAGGTELVQM
jgi:hypothetical protein